MNEDSTPTGFKENLTYVNRITEEVLRVSDRARAVLLGAEIDSFLKKILEGYLLPKSSKSGRLLESSGPLGSFASRIEIAFRLGLISPEWHHDLQIMNQIRNEFAHGSVGMTMNEKPVIDLCQKLKLGKKWIENAKNLNAENGDNPQTRFVGAGVLLLAHFCIISTQVKRVPETWKTYPEDSVQLPCKSDV